ncbi:hypothetical protein EJ05DRAFT_326794 [Pseudovirgaria hyperparasitica]|uniref:BTB domain-containing protein n=1 Tax=Pseudovirgaria hyperparasitica TaxID=470096 RepID=A0A6A6W7Q6_9PEZI|nr:uncharacterized protein EJ05DRAFT_326794 [Pseudovirgaria hyperparasitica]KAF2758928.1 hypothetical protein EJ05DRAFT_326794 [Pseudovirgaria hyperparasitica]
MAPLERYDWIAIVIKVKRDGPPDLTVACGEVKINVHKGIVSKECEFFKKACGGESQGTIDKIIRLDDDPVNAVMATIEYMYTGQYGNTLSRGFSPHNDDHQIDTAIQVCAIAKKYNIPGLLEVAVFSFRCHVDNMWWPPMDYRDKIREIYGSSNSSSADLQQSVVVSAYRMLKRLLPKDGFERFLWDQGRFTTDILLHSQLKHISRKDIYQRLRRCPKCAEGIGIDLKPNSGYKCPDCGKDSNGSLWVPIRLFATML